MFHRVGVAKYRQKLSGRLLDRLDVHVRLPPVVILMKRTTSPFANAPKSDRSRRILKHQPNSRKSPLQRSGEFRTRPHEPVDIAPRLLTAEDSAQCEHSPRHVRMAIAIETDYPQPTVLALVAGQRQKPIATENGVRRPELPTHQATD